MKKRVLLTMGFLLISLKINAFTEKEIIQNDLEKLGVKQEIINQTINIETEIGDKILVGNGKKYIPYLESIYKKDNKNFVIANMINTYNSRYDKEKYKKNKKMIDLYIKYVPYEYEKLSASYIYNTMIDNKKIAQESLHKIHEKYNGSWISEWLSIGKNETIEGERRRVKRTIEKMAVEKKDIANGISDEDFYYIITVYNGLVIKELTEKQNWQKAVDYFIENVASQDIKENIVKRYSRTLSNQFDQIMSINEKLDEKSANENAEKIKNTKMYKILMTK